MLSFKEMSGYQIAKNVRHHGEAISSGTLVPILRNLESAGLVQFRESGNKKLYSLTAKGEKYIGSLREIGAEIKKKMFVETMDQNMLYYDILTNLEDVEAIKRVLDRFGDIILELIKVGFRLEKLDSVKKLEQLETDIQDILEEQQ